jgi:hypothetical protein
MAEFGFFCSSTPPPPLTAFVPYVGATANVDLGAFSLTSPTIYGSGLASGTLTLASTSNATKGKILFGTSAYDEVNNRLGIGTTSPGVALDIIGTGSISNLLTCGQINAYTSNLGLYAKNANSSIFFGTNVGANILAQWNGISTSGAVTTFTFTTPAHTNQTATTNIPNFRISGANKQWATGTVANQYWNYLTANTAAFVGASTMTNSYGLFVEAATAGTNATITNNYAAGFSGRVSQEGLGSSTFFGSGCGVRDDLTNNLNTGFGANALLTNISGSSNCAFGYQALRATTVNNNTAIGYQSQLATTTGDQNTTLGASSLLSNQTGGGNTAIGALCLLQSTGNYNTAVGNYSAYNVTSGVLNTIIGYDTGGGITTGSRNTVIGSSVTGLTSTLSNNVIIADGAGNKVLWFNSTNALISDLKIDTTTGIKIATATTQKLAFWNATPIVQPTTAVAAATVVSGAGGNVKHDDTFDGYTVEQIVRALRNTGLLA